MKRLLLSIAIATFAFVAADQSDRADACGPDSSGGRWVQLFNGKDLTGWKTHPNDKAKWDVKDGILTGTGQAGHLFSERGDYENFRYRVEAKINNRGNSGQYFRTEYGPSFPKGYEAQINATHGDRQKTGGLYNFVGVFKQKHKPDEWFTQEVIAVGNRIIIKVNGETTCDFVDSDNTYKKGHFALQQHDPGTVIQFRKIEVMELPPGSAVAQGTSDDSEYYYEGRGRGRRRGR